MIRKFAYRTCFVCTLFISVFNCDLVKANQQSECIKALVKDAMNVMNMEKKTMAQKRQIIVNKYMPYINFEWNAKMALGRPYLALSPEKQKEYIKAYTEFLSYAWLPKLSYDKDSGIKIIVQDKTENLNDKDENVTVNIITFDGKKYEAFLRVRYDNNKCQILNVTAEGVDLAMSYRSQFTSYIEEHKGDPVSIVEYLKQQNDTNKKKAGFVVKVK